MTQPTKASVSRSFFQQARAFPGTALLGAGLLLLGAANSTAQTPPDPPLITEPAMDGQVVSPFDVHMETADMSDPDPGDTHLCTDWEIWTIAPLERVWFTGCISGLEAVHTHLGDGFFEGSHTGRSDLLYETDYKLRVRHRDNTSLWSDYSERLFETGAPGVVFPLDLDEIADSPPPQWTDDEGVPLILPGGGLPPFIRVESPAGDSLLIISGFDGVTNQVVNPPPLADHEPVRVVADGGGSGLSVVQSQLKIWDENGNEYDIYLPGLNVAGGEQAFYWISENGSSYDADTSQTVPDFSTLARGSPVPWTISEPGYKVEVMAAGFQLPVNIAFVPNPGQNPGDPYYYVTELYGIIKVVTRDGTVSDYAQDLLNFNPTGQFPGSGEQGLAGIVVEPVTGDIYAGYLYDSAPPDGPHYPKVVRFHSSDGGLTADSSTTILDMPGEEQGQSHFISNFTLGPDGKLYVHMGDGFTSSTALDLDSFRGKILRMELDGSPDTTNTFYDPGDGINSRDYIFAYGFRNPFGGAWRASDGQHYQVENGPGENDRLSMVTEGTSYAWDGTVGSLTTYALYNWNPTSAPVNIAFIEPETFGGSEFPSSTYGRAYVTESGPTYATGPQSRGKRIVYFDIASNGTGVSNARTTMVRYTGSGKATASGLAAGPDGLYFTDLYKDLDAASAIERGANVLRIKFVGGANFTAQHALGPAPRPVLFFDTSTVPSPQSWLWDFGDSTTSTAQNPYHVYSQEGSYNVSLTVQGADGPVITRKFDFVKVGDFTNGLEGSYFDDGFFNELTLTRIDSVIDFNWGGGSPGPAISTNNFTVRWEGQVEAGFTEIYTFYTETDDGVRLWVDNQLIIDQWVDQPATEHSGTIPLNAGEFVNLKMEYYEAGGNAVARLRWSSPSQVKEIIPSNRLRPVRVIGVEPSPAPPPRMFLSIGANPFRHGTSVTFSVPESDIATLSVFDVRGRQVSRLFEGVARGGETYRIPFDARDRASGIYFIRLGYRGAAKQTKILHLR